MERTKQVSTVQNAKINAQRAPPIRIAPIVLMVTPSTMITSALRAQAQAF
jgi:hypothetical protein